MPISRRLVSASLATVVALFGCTKPASRSLTRGYDARVADGIDQLRAATRPYRSLDSAVAAGYPRTVPDCIVDAHHGAMGYHHVNRAYVDAKLEIDRPEILLYERMPDSTYRLNGVEFILPYRYWPRDTVAPVFMGQTLAREDNFKYWFLHVWAWTNNQQGLFAPFNPDVACLGGTGKVYIPSP